MIRSLQLQNFRNLQDLSFNPVASVNYLYGDNAQGKSNFLEALYFSISGQSFRQMKPADLICFGTSFSTLKAEILQSDLNYEVFCRLEGETKELFLNQKKTTSYKLRSRFPCVVFSPESLSAIKSSSEERRNLVDDSLLLIRPDSYTTLMDYRKILKTRNRLLRDLSLDNNEALTILESLQPKFKELSIKLTQLRVESLISLQPHFEFAMHQILGNVGLDLEIRYLFSGLNAMQSLSWELEQKISERMDQLWNSELTAGTSLSGPHRHEISFFLNGKEARFFCSQGQQRTLILAFKLAQIVYHSKVHKFYPILLLDDVLSELDGDKRNALLNYLKEVRTQIFLTTTDKESTPFQSQDGLYFHVDNGRITEGKKL